MEPKRILVLSHTSNRSGGAETALFELLVHFRQQGHFVSVMLSDTDGDERDRYESIGAQIILFPCIWALPDFPRALFELSNNVDWNSIADQLRHVGFTHVLSNTLVQIHGAIIAAKLNIVHITYVHEFLCDGKAFDLHPSGIGGENYCKLIEDLSDQVWTCSKFTASQFRRNVQVVYPRFGPIRNLVPFKPLDTSQPINVVCIGTKNVRKNVAFFLILAKATGLLEMPINFKWIGHVDQRGIDLLQTHIPRRSPFAGPVHIEFLPYHPEPFRSIEDLPNKIVFIGAISEPFGLTALEAMERGIPVISSKCGGPQELLPPEQLFEVNNIHQAVACLRHVISNYNEIASRLLAFEPSVPELTDEAPRPKNLQFIEQFKAIHLHDRTPEGFLEFIQTTPDVLRDEHERPGSTVLKELRLFGATPFSYSPEMERFYEHGIGMAVELADTLHDRNKEYMIAFIVSALMHSPGTRILSVGDGIANDSLRLTRAGFEVSYLDFDEGGTMTEIAKRNTAGTSVQFVSDQFANDNPFGAVMCLEVIEHVSDPDVLIHSLARKTRPGGLLFMSECFEGVRDQWATHLYTNEQFTGLLPAMMDPWFELMDVHRDIPGKPFMFRRTNVQVDSGVLPSKRRWFMDTRLYGSLRAAFDAKTNSSLMY
jgi:glycosyltransferase involved in cell wall biosynthesis/SAM-dependent methyltransferase